MKKATFYSRNSNGIEAKPVSLPVGKYDIDPMKESGIINDGIYKIDIPDGLEVTLYTNGSFEGPSLTVNSSSSDLGDLNMATSSIIIENLKSNSNPILINNNKPVDLSAPAIIRPVPLPIIPPINNPTRPQVNLQPIPKEVSPTTESSFFDWLPDIPGISKNTSGIILSIILALVIIIAIYMLYNNI
jgi:hypothetical protein